MIIDYSEHKTQAKEIIHPSDLDCPINVLSEQQCQQLLR